MKMYPHLYAFRTIYIIYIKLYQKLLCTCTWKTYKWLENLFYYEIIKKKNTKRKILGNGNSSIIYADVSVRMHLTL